MLMVVHAAEARQAAASMISSLFFICDDADGWEKAGVLRGQGSAGWSFPYDELVHLLSRLVSDDKGQLA